jgi:hypothetical protein
MSNMGYCRFENAHRDLSECARMVMCDGIGCLSESEAQYADRLRELCERYINDYDEAKALEKARGA